MADQKVQVETVEKNVALERAKGFWAKFSKPIIIVGSVIIVFLGGFYIYKHFVKEPKEQNAKDAIFGAERVFDKMANSTGFSKDSVNIVLNGSKADNITGLLSIISKYDGTSAANRANYMTGACYLQLKEFDKAIKYLKEFDGNGADQIQSKDYLMLGHAYAEKKNSEEALSYYKKAATAAGDYQTSAGEALFTAGMYAESLGKTKDAIELFQQIKDKYPESARATSGDADKYLARLGVTK
jgi:TolA-binding protein